jgi:hypothetical protein
MAGSLSVASTAVSSSKVAVVDSDEVINQTPFRALIGQDVTIQQKYINYLSINNKYKRVILQDYQHKILI